MYSTACVCVCERTQPDNARYMYMLTSREDSTSFDYTYIYIWPISFSVIYYTAALMLLSSREGWPPTKNPALSARYTGVLFIELCMICSEYLFRFLPLSDTGGGNELIFYTDCAAEFKSLHLMRF